MRKRIKIEFDLIKKDEDSNLNLKRTFEDYDLIKEMLMYDESVEKLNVEVEDNLEFKG